MTEPADDLPSKASDASGASASAGHATRSDRQSRSHWHRYRWAWRIVIALVALFLIGIATIWWALRTESGSAWLTRWVPNVTFVAPTGSLIGDFAAQRIDVTLADGRVLRIDAPRWHALTASRGDHGRWLHLEIATLHADRVTLLPSPKPVPAAAPSPPLTSLRLPIEIEIAEASVGELRIGGPDAAPVRALQAHVHLGADGGSLHRIEHLTARTDQAAMLGSATIRADAPLDVDAQMGFASNGMLPAWRAGAAARGPLAALAVTAVARVLPGDGKPPQALDATALVHPFATWPLGALHARTEALDLAAFTSAAPATALTGEATIESSGIDRPAVMSIRLDNGRAGRWNEGLLPLRSLHGEVRARPDNPKVFDVSALDAELGTLASAGGRITGQGQWNAGAWSLNAVLAAVRPSALDARAPETVLNGKVASTGSGFSGPADSTVVDISADLAGQLVDRRLPRSAPQNAHVKFAVHVTPLAISLTSAEARLGTARASLSGALARRAIDAPWQAAGHGELDAFDPAPWWPGAPDSLLMRGANRLDAKTTFDLALPMAAAANAASAAKDPSIYETLDQLHGKADLAIDDSVLAGVSLSGSMHWLNDASPSRGAVGAGGAKPSIDLLIGGNRVRANGTLVAAGGSADAWQLAIEAPQLATLSPFFTADAAPRTPGGTNAGNRALAGSLVASAQVRGRWPDVTSEGDLHANGVRFGTVSVQSANGRWRIGSADNAPLDGSLTLDGVASAGRVIERVVASLNGTARAHRAELRIESAALPPTWADALLVKAKAAASSPTASEASTSVATRAATALNPNARSAVVVSVEGGLVAVGSERAAGWRGTVHDATAQSLASNAGPAGRVWLRAHELRGALFWSGGPAHAELDPGTLEVLGATVRWSRASWLAGVGNAPADIELMASIDAIPIAPFLRAAQPDFGWGGDLAVAAHIDVHGATAPSVDMVVERTTGDLSVADELGVQPLGLTDLRLGVATNAGAWNFTAGLAGNAFGVVSGAVVARPLQRNAWPSTDTPISGVLELRVANLGTWGPWVPSGWRLGGELHANAAFGGTLGAPEYTGHVEGSHLGARNFLQGVNVTDGDMAIALKGSSAHIEHFTAKGGKGTLTIAGDASFDAAPVANLVLTADRFEVLGRVDRRIVSSGRATIKLDATTLALDGGFKIDEGLIDFTRADAPTLSEDVEVVRRPSEARAAAVNSASAAASASTSSAASSATAAAAPTARKVALHLRVNMGEQLRIRGRGLDASLRGELLLTSSSNGGLLVNGTLSAIDGTYQAYGQNLAITRAVLTFAGPVDNPRLDIEAVRPDLDVRVGVNVSGTAQNPRIRLFSDPDMTDVDKLSYLVTGSASDSASGSQTALLQQAALALLSGEGPGVTDRLTKAIGLDSIGVRQADGDVKNTIVSLGKQISKRWYVGYERGLNATAGTWQLIYRVAQRITVRAQAGEDNSVDLIWTWRWH